MHAGTVATYDRIAAEFADRWWSTRLSAHMDRFASRVVQGGVVVDLGCGPGRDTAWLAELGFDAVGVDASSGMLGEARRRVGVGVGVGVVDLVQGDLVALPLASSGADGAWMCASLLHLTVEEAEVALREVRRVLRAGAPLFVSVQAGEGGTTKSSSVGDRRFTFWSVEGLANQVVGAGFRVDVAELSEAEGAAVVRWVAVHAEAVQ